jgi:hypothetical protein
MAVEAAADFDSPTLVDAAVVQARLHVLLQSAYVPQCGRQPSQSQHHQLKRIRIFIGKIHSPVAAI